MSGNPLKQPTTSTATSAYPQTSRSSLAFMETQKQQISEFVREKHNREVTEFWWMRESSHPRGVRSTRQPRYD